MCSHGYFYQGSEKQTRAILKGHYCLYYLTMSHFIKRTVYRTRISYCVPKLIFSRGRGGGALIWRGRLLQILSLRRGANSKRGAYLKLGANSSIYGKYYFFYQESLKPAQTSFVCESPGKYTKCYPLPLRTIFFFSVDNAFFSGMSSA